MNRSDFQQLAEVRLSEARILMDAGFPDGAYYLAGYAIECALKACIAKRTQQFDFPDKKLAADSYTHKLNELLKLAQLNDDLNAAEMDIRNRWRIVQDWSEEGRYRRYAPRQAGILLEAIESSSGGILPWIRQRW